ncbi:MAG TPA: N-6 DNA methylase, partial [Longimicrobiales bacterium]
MFNIADNIFSRAGVLAFARKIGFTDQPIRSPRDASVELLGQRGTLSCFLVITSDVTSANLTRAARHLRHSYAAELQLFVFALPDYSQIAVATFTGADVASLTLERGRIHASDLDALNELIPQNGEGGLQLALRHARALDRVRVTHRFFEDFRGQRAVVAEAWQGIAPRCAAERNQLALLLLSRLMFLYFLQRRGFLAGQRDYFRALLRTHFSTTRRYTFYRGVLRPLFFGVLNRRPEKRTQRAAALGALPYLNGGLFERHHHERRSPSLDLADDVLRGVFEHLLERYRFTASEGTHDLAVDPEMLGRVFEGLMEDSTRQSTGTFYTPASVVQRMVSSALSAHLSTYALPQRAQVLREVRVLDPACGSGAFLLSA